MVKRDPVAHRTSIIAVGVLLADLADEQRAHARARPAAQGVADLEACRTTGNVLTLAAAKRPSQDLQIRPDPDTPSEYIWATTQVLGECPSGRCVPCLALQCI